MQIIKKMLKLYYEIWVDFIYVPSQNNTKYWKFYTMLMFVFCQSIVFMFGIIVFELKIINYKFYDLYFIFGNKVPEGLHGFILYALPFIIFNYFMIFYKNRYKQLIVRYEYKKGKYLVNYILISGGIAFIGIFLLFILFNPS